MRQIPALLFCAFAARTAPLHAQPFYQRTIGGFMIEDAYTLAALPDSGLVVGGCSYGFVSGTNAVDLYATRFNRNGDMLWSRHYDCGIVSSARGMSATGDGGLLISGTNNNVQGILFKVDQAGIPMWGWGTSAVENYSGVSLSDSGHIFTAGQTHGSNSDIQVEKFQTDGSLIWSRRFGTAYSDLVNGVVATGDGGTAMVGQTVTGADEYDALLMKIDANGALQWSRTIGVPSDLDQFYAVLECLSGGFLAAGGGGYFSVKPFVVRYNELGDTLWAKRFDLHEGRIRSLAEVPGGFLVGGDLSASSSVPFVMLINEDGEVIWERTFTTGQQQATNANTMARLADGSIAMLGTSLDVGPGSRDFFLVVADHEGLGTDCGSGGGIPSVLPTTWYVTSYGDTIGPGWTSPYLPPSYPAPTLLQTECGDVAVRPFAPMAFDLRYSEATRTINVTCGSRAQLDLFDLLGRRMDNWSLAEGTTLVPLPSHAQGTLLIRLADKQGITLYCSRIFVLGQ